MPAYKNPLYATNTAEKDVAALMHAGLLKYDNEGGFMPHLATTWRQEDKNNYLFTLKENVSFHDGTPITAKDIAYTIKMVQEDPENPRREVWVGAEVTDTENSTIKITIPEGNIHFPEGFTTPILPEHIWKKIPIEKRKRYKGSGAYIGAGPYKFDQETVTLDEQPTHITLIDFPGYVLERPFIEKNNSALLCGNQRSAASI